MKKLLAIAFAAVAAFALASCTTTTDMTKNQSGWSNYAEITVKDFEPVGIVQVETKETTDVSPFYFSRSHVGKRIVYADLMAEAKKLGADDIINIRVDARNEGEKKAPIAEFFGGNKIVTTYYGTAIAIKYTNVKPNQTVAIDENVTQASVASSDSSASTSKKQKKSWLRCWLVDGFCNFYTLGLFGYFTQK